MKRTVIKIDENLCNGCGNCVGGCNEGALQLIDGKAVMISDLYCDGLGACIGECPLGAITFEEREAGAYDESAVMERLVPRGKAAVLAHLKHLKDHNETEWVRQGAAYLKDHNINGVDISKICLDTVGNTHITEPEPDAGHLACGCPGSMARRVNRPMSDTTGVSMQNPELQPQRSELSHFPVQLHLVNPQAGFFANADLLLAADCTAFASGSFHSRFLKNKVLAIACPKLDNNTQVYIDKLSDMIDHAQINTMTVLVMEVPCCGGLVRMAQLARSKARRNIPVKVIVLTVNGDVESEEWV